MLRAPNNARKILPKSNMSDITGHSVLALMARLAHSRSWTFEGSKFNPPTLDVLVNSSWCPSARHTIWAATIQISYNQSRSFLGRWFSVDSSWCSSECLHKLKAQSSHSSCSFPSKSNVLSVAVIWQHPQLWTPGNLKLIFWDARVLDRVEKHKWCQKDASIIIKHVCHHSSCNLCLHGRTCP